MSRSSRAALGAGLCFGLVLFLCGREAGSADAGSLLKEEFLLLARDEGYDMFLRGELLCVGDAGVARARHRKSEYQLFDMETPRKEQRRVARKVCAHIAKGSAVWLIDGSLYLYSYQYEAAGVRASLAVGDGGGRPARGFCMGTRECADAGRPRERRNICDFYISDAAVGGVVGGAVSGAAGALCAELCAGDFVEFYEMAKEDGVVSVEVFSGFDAFDVDDVRLCRIVWALDAGAWGGSCGLSFGE